MKNNVSRWKVRLKVAVSWWWVLLSLFIMFILTIFVAALLMRIKVPPQTILSALTWTLVGAVILFFFSEFLINIFMGARRVDEKIYPDFVAVVKEVHESVPRRWFWPRSWFRPRIRILPMPVPNAMAYGIGVFGQCCIAITPPLYRMMDRDELKAVVAHEYGHIRSLDIALMTVVGVFAGAVERLRALAAAGAGSGLTAMLWLPAIVLWIISKMFFGVLRMAISQEREFAADALAAWYQRTPDHMISALKKLGSYQERRTERIFEKEREQSKKREESGRQDEDDEPVTKRGRGTVFKDLMISHPHMDARITSLESLRA